MSGARPVTTGWLRLFLTQLAVTGMLLHAALPAAATPNRAAMLRLLGATLCTRHDAPAPDRQPDGHPAACDHCPLCEAATASPLAILAEAAAPPPPPAVGSARPPARRAFAPPRAPPRLAHAARAPPAA